MLLNSAIASNAKRERWLRSITRKLYATDVASGAERVMTTVGLPKTAQNVAGLSSSPDGQRLYTSYLDAPYDIWMLEGFR